MPFKRWKERIKLYPDLVVAIPTDMNSFEPNNLDRIGNILNNRLTHSEIRELAWKIVPIACLETRKKTLEVLDPFILSDLATIVADYVVSAPLLMEQRTSQEEDSKCKIEVIA